MKRVLEVAYPALNNSGVPAVIMGIVRELYNDFKFDVLVFRKDTGYFKDEFLSYGGNIYTISCDKKKNKIYNVLEKITRPFKIYYGTKRILKKNNYDAIHCHNAWDAGWCLLAAKKLNIKTRIIHSHSTTNSCKNDSFFAKLYHKVMRKIILYNNCIKIGCSKAASDNLYGENKGDLVILNAVDINKFSYKKITNKTILKDSPRFVFVGRFAEQKNPIFLLNVFNEILNFIPNATLNMIGFGPLEEDILKKINEYKIMDKVKILSHSSDIPEVFCNSDFFLFPSLYEGFGIVLIEAQCMGLHCFASDVIPRESDLGLCEYYSLNKDSNYWAKKIVEHIKKGKNDKIFPSKECIEKYSWKNIAQQYKKIYEDGEKKEC